jgi:subtilisin family serine protease
MAKRKRAKGQVAGTTNNAQTYKAAPLSLGSSAPQGSSQQHGLDADFHTGASTVKTGRLKVINLNRSSTGSFKSMMADISKTTGLGTRASAICSSSDFGLDGIDRQQAQDAEVLVLERLGIAYVRVDDDQKASALMRSQSAEATGYIVEPEQVRYSLGFPSRAASFESMRSDLADSGPYSHSPENFAELLQSMADLAKTQLAAETPVRTAQTFNDTAEATWGLQAVRALSARHSGADIKVAILDSGMDLGHPDFAGRSIQSKAFVTTGNLKIGDLIVPQLDTEVHDINGHGTHCVGSACGPRTSQFGPGYGVAFGAEIFVGKVMFQHPITGGGVGFDSDIQAGIEWAMQHGCQVISMSIGSPAEANGTFPADYEIAAFEALNNGHLIIAATGNGSQRPGFVDAVSSPANCPSVAGVAAIDRFERIAPFSNGRVFSGRGAEVNFSGPGVDVISSVPLQLPAFPSSGPLLRTQTKTAAWDGTSMATPHASGIAALIADETGLRGLELYREMRRRVRSLGAKADFGHGLVQF